MRLQRIRPRGSRTHGRGLRNITHNREGLQRSAPHQNPPLHRRELLGLVHNHVPVGPFPVAFGPLDRAQTRSTVLVELKQHIFIDHTVDADLFKLRVDVLKRFLCVLNIALALQFLSALRTRGHRQQPQQLRGLIQQRNIRLRERYARLTQQCLTRGRREPR